MAHIVYGGKFYPLSDDAVAETRKAVNRATSTPGSIEVELMHPDGDKSYLYVSAGVSIAINDWDLNELGL